MNNYLRRTEIIDPLACVVNVLRQSTTWQEVLARLPDIGPEKSSAMNLTVRCSG
jgi:hypothetical protein